jgi:hypothetical protein
MIGCNNYVHFEWFVAQAHPSGLGRGLGTKPTPFNLLSLAGLTLKFYLRADPRVLVMKFF